MTSNDLKKQNLSAFYLQNSLYWLHNKLKIEKKEVEFYVNGNSIRIKPKEDLIEVFKNDISIGEFPEHVGFKLILDSYLIPNSRKKAQKTIDEANKLIF